MEAVGAKLARIHRAESALVNPVAAKFRARAVAADTLLCVGLDPVLEQMPLRFLSKPSALFEFCRFIVDQTATFAAAFKPNTAFFEAYGAHGWQELEKLCRYTREAYPQHVLICDAKRGDIGNTNRGYAKAVFDELGCDAITLHPYLGREALEPFLAHEDKACIVLCRTSNAGAGELQDLICDGKPLWQIVAERVTREWDRDGNCMLVVGATYPDEMRQLRTLAPETIFLVPGLGAQGGDVAAVVAAGLDAQGGGLMLSASRSILQADDPAAAARSLRDEINAAREVLHAAR